MIVKNLRIAVCALSVVLLGAGCAAGEPTEGPAAVSPSTSLESQIDLSWEDFHALYPDVPRPDVTVARIVGPDEQMLQMVSCLNDAGFTTVTGDSTGYSWSDIPPEQQEPFALAQYVCTATYPLDPKYSAPLTEQQLTMLYNYFVGDLTHCVEDQGIAVSAPPSLQEFIESEGGIWSPFDDVAASDTVELADLEVLCPQTPDSLYE